MKNDTRIFAWTYIPFGVSKISNNNLENYIKDGANLLHFAVGNDNFVATKLLLENGFEADLEYCSTIDIIDEIPAYANGVLKKLK